MTEVTPIEPVVQPTEQLTTEVKPVVTPVTEKVQVVPPTPVVESTPSKPLDMAAINKAFEEKLQTIQAQYEKDLVAKTTELNTSYSEKISTFEEKLSALEGRKGIVPTEVSEPVVPNLQPEQPIKPTVEEMRNIKLTPVQEAEAAQAFLDSMRK